LNRESGQSGQSFVFEKQARTVREGEVVRKADQLGRDHKKRPFRGSKRRRPSRLHLTFIPKRNGKREILDRRKI